MVSCPLLTPRTFLCAATPFGRASKRGLRGLGSGRLSAYIQLSCPEFRLRGWQRCQCAARRCRAAAFCCEPLRFDQWCTLGAPDVPVGPSHFAARPQGVAAQRKVRGVKRGQETMFGVLSPFVPAGEHRLFPGCRRRPMCTLTSSVKPPPAASRWIGGRSAVC